MNFVYYFLVWMQMECHRHLLVGFMSFVDKTRGLKRWCRIRAYSTVPSLSRWIVTCAFKGLSSHRKLTEGTKTVRATIRPLVAIRSCSTAICWTGMVLDWLIRTLAADLHVDRRSMSSLIDPSTSSVIASTASVWSWTVAATTLLRHLRRRSCRQEFNSGLVPVPAAATITVLSSWATPSQWKDPSPVKVSETVSSVVLSSRSNLFKTIIPANCSVCFCLPSLFWSKIKFLCCCDVVEWSHLKIKLINLFSVQNQRKCRNKKKTFKLNIFINLLLFF